MTSALGLAWLQPWRLLVLAWGLGIAALAPHTASAAPNRPALAMTLPSEATVLLWRGVDCGEAERSKPVRRVRRCLAEERALAHLSADGTVHLQPLDRVPPRLALLPAELALQWHYCPASPDSRLEQAGLPWVPYEDPVIARCYVYRPRDLALQEQIAEKARLDLLEVLHPWLRDALTTMIVRAAAQGIEVKVISTVRSVKSRAVTVEKLVKRKGKLRKVRVATGERKMGMHPLGLAVDINLGWGKSLGDPVRAYRARGETYRQFQALGDMADELGIVWLGRVMVGEIGHFEHHPGWWGSVRGQFRRQLLQGIAVHGVPSVWEHFRYDARLTSPFGALRDRDVTAPAAPPAP